MATSSAGPTNTISVLAGGGSGTVTVTSGPGCHWISSSPVDWVTITPANATGSGTATATIAPNPGPARQTTVVVGGHIVTVVQAGAAAFTGPEISSVITVAGGAPVSAQNAWMEVHGIKLSATTRLWQGSDFLNNQMPTQLDGVSVTVNGKPAFVEYISLTQINILTPLDTAQGTVQVKVTSGGVTSASIYVPVQTAAPGFFLFGRGPYVAATHALGNYLGPASLYPGLTTPAKPGEVVTLYAGGFGQTSPAILDGSLTQSGNLTPQPVIIVGGTRAVVQFAGVTAPGLYQFNIVIPPSTPDGDATIAATYAGFTTQAGVLIPVQH
jgi:uncharacterized protein (TIGR03437 family)